MSLAVMAILKCLLAEIYEETDGNARQSPIVRPSIDTQVLLHGYLISALIHEIKCSYSLPLTLIFHGSRALVLEYDGEHIWRADLW